MVRMSGARAVVTQLKREGVQQAFTVPGESFLSILDALYDDDQIELIATRHEEGAAFAAEAIGKLTGQPALCMSTRGVGSTNMAIAFHTAYQDSSPLIAIIGQVETPYRHREAFQEVELAPFYAHICKWTAEVTRTERLPEYIHEAARRAIGGRPGPVLLSVPTDILDAEVEFDEEHFRPRAIAPRPAPSAYDVNAALDILLNAERPLIMAGGGVLRAGATDDLIAFAEATGIPVITAYRRYHAFPNRHPLYLGGMGLGAPPTVAARLREADALLAIGTRFGEFSTATYSVPTLDTKIVHIDIDPDIVGVNFPAAVGIVSNARQASRALNAALPQRDDPRRAARQEAAVRDRATYEGVSTPATIAARTPVDPTGVLADLRRLLPPETIITGDAGNFWTWFGRYHRFGLPGAYLGPTSGAMGYAMPAALGAAFARPDVPVLAVAGDGGFLMTGQELETAVRHKLRIIALVFNNNSYGTIRMHQERTFPGRVSGTALGAVDFAMFARSLGAHGERVADNRDFAPALERALALNGPALIEVTSDPEMISVGQTIAQLQAR
jgi:acetolactate synthase-1/2/3 large subunit